MKLLLLALLGVQAPAVVLATTTSTQDSGLLDSLLPVFEHQSGYRVKVISVGSGQALELGKRGDADVVLSHAPEQERALVAAGYFASRRRVMYNDFILVGPRADSAGLAGGRDAVQALRRLAAAHAPFVSRGDRSGTHQLELTLWQRAGITPPGQGTTYLEAGQGMAATLQIASQRHGYTLTDRATFLAWRDRLELVPLVTGDTLLRNIYHVLLVDARNAGARALAQFFLSPEANAVISAFGRRRFGEPLFVADTIEPL
jgi:tungstate transport system substrate-binding protein